MASRKDISGARNPNWKGGPVVYKCEQCGTAATAKRAQGKKRFCSLTCANEWQRENPYGAPRKKRVQKQCKQCGTSFNVLPSRISRRYFCSHDCQFAWRSVHHSASNNPNWRGGSSLEPYPFSWTEAREAIIERDGNRCISPRCRDISDTVNVHHINYVKADCRPANLITLCASCNARANFDRDQWTQYFRDLLSGRYGYGYEEISKS